MNDILYNLLTLGLGEQQYNYTLYNNSNLLVSIYLKILLIPFVFKLSYYLILGKTSFFAKNSWYFIILFCSMITVYFSTYKSIDLFMYEIDLDDTFHKSNYNTSAIIAVLYSTLISVIITNIFMRLKIGVNNYNIPNFKSTK